MKATGGASTGGNGSDAAFSPRNGSANAGLSPIAGGSDDANFNKTGPIGANFGASNTFVDTGFLQHLDNLAATSVQKVTAKALVSHHFGFGNLNVPKIGSPTQSKITGFESSGKFAQKLQLKQKMLETQMMENRLRKLHNEEVRLQK